MDPVLVVDVALDSDWNVDNENNNGKIRRGLLRCQHNPQSSYFQGTGW